MAVDRLDAVVIGASVEGLVAAAALATAGKAVAVVERRAENAPLGEGHDAVVDLKVVRELDLTAHGMRFAAAPPLIGVAGERALVLWPELHAAQASVASVSPRDAEALEVFYARVVRAAAGGAEAAGAAAWLTSGESEPSDAIMFRVSSLARLLDEAFDSELLKGLLAQSAIMGTGAAPHAPASGQLLTRTSMLAQVVPSAGHRFVAGGERRLRQALLALLKFYNNADVAFGLNVREIAVDRDAVQGVVLTDGNLLRAPQVISTLSYERSKEMLLGLRRPLSPYLPPKASVEPALVKLTVGTLPKLPGVDPATLASGAIVRLQPSLTRLAAAHGAFRALMAPSEPCVELRVVPLQLREGKARWDVFVSMPYVPVTTAEGPWTGARREKLRSIAVRAIDAMVPGFGASIEAAEILRPAESETLMDPRGAQLLAARALVDQTAVPEVGVAGAPTLIKGLTVVEPSLYGGVGDAGLMAAATGSLSKARADA
jgi:phytoene dehydrogenase-like protein